MTKKNKKDKVHPLVPLTEPPYPSTSFAPSAYPYPNAPLPGPPYVQPPIGFQPSLPNVPPQDRPLDQCYFGSPPPPYPASSVSSNSDTYDSTKYSPPLPPREEIVIGRHAARFDIKQKYLDGSRSNQSRQRRFINPIVSGKRKCTDVPCCLLFIIFVCGWVFVAFLGFTWGKPERLLHPSDSDGRMCGVERKGFYNLRSKPYLLYFDITKCASYSIVIAGCQTTQLCVERCPSKTYTYYALRTIAKPAEFQKKLAENIICKDSINKKSIRDFNALRKLVRKGDCTRYTVSSVAVLGRCIPDVLTKTLETVAEFGNSLNNVKNISSATELLTTELSDPEKESISAPHIMRNASSVVMALVQKSSVLEKIASDLSVTWWQIIVMLVATAFISFLWTFVMRLFGSLLIWTTIIFVAVSLFGGSGYSWWRFKALYDVGAINDYSFYPSMDVYFEMPTTWLIIAIILTIAAVIIALILIFVRSRITLAIALIQESSSAVGAIMTSLLLPIILFLLHILIFAGWGAISIWIASSGTENCRKSNFSSNGTDNGTECDCALLGTGKDPTCQYVNLTRNENQVMAMQIYNLVGFLWSSWFVSAVCDVTLAGAFASYYWAFNKRKDVPPFPILLALRRALRYHLGTIAFGSLIITTVKLFRIILDYIDRKLSVTENKVLQTILKGFKCLFWCVEAFLKFLTRNAYIMTAIYGTGFFTAARDSFNLIWNNAIRYAVLDKVTDFLLFLGKATITIGMGVVAFHWFAGRWEIEGLPHIDLYYYFVPIIVVIIGAYLIADLFFGVYEMAVKTTFLCFVEDAQNNDGTPDKPYYMSKELKRIMGLENQFRCNLK